MIREEAIRRIESIKPYAGRNIKDALDMAIEALEQELVLDKIRAEIEAIIGEHRMEDYDFCSGLIAARKIIDKYKAKSEEK